MIQKEGRKWIRLPKNSDIMSIVCHLNTEGRDFMVNIYLLPADEGDFIWVRYGDDGNYANILIDGGTKDSGAEYAEIIEWIGSHGEKIEALVLTHIDYDHLQGAVEGIGKVPADMLQKVVKRILFNTCRGISREQKRRVDRYAEEQVKVKKFTGAYGIGEAVAFMDLLEEKGISGRLMDYVVSGMEMIWDKHACVKVISPGSGELNHFLNHWEPYCKENDVTSYTTNLEMVQGDLNKLMKGKLGYDSSVNNEASIAFLFEYDGIRISFLADSKPAVCMRGLKELGVQMPYHVDVMKLSHHGSRNNTSDMLLKNLETEAYMLSTNGHRKKVPNKVTIAHLLKNAGGKKVCLFCNYDWWETAYHGKFFTSDDKKTFITTNYLELFLPDENGVTVKEGLKIYGEWAV